MTGIDIVKKNMEDLGATKAQIASKTVELVVMAIANEEDFTQIRSDYLRMIRAKNDADAVLRQAEGERSRAEFARNEARNERSYLAIEMQKVVDAREKLKAERESFLAELETIETAEARDRYRMAKWYERTVEPENGYERTSFIQALGAILAGEGVKYTVAPKPDKETGSKPCKKRVEGNEDLEWVPSLGRARRR